MTPVLRYRDPGAAARWLCEAFGFRQHDSTQGAGHRVGYVELRLGDSSVLVRPVSSSAFDDLMVEPAAVGGGNTHVLYVAVPDAYLHSARARAAGAKIEIDPQDDGLGGRFYTCRDPEGHLWSFGTKSYGTTASKWPANAAPPAKGGTLRRSLGLVALAGALLCGWLFYESNLRNAAEPGAAMATGTTARIYDASERLDLERSRRLAAEDAAKKSAALLTDEQARRLAAEAASVEAAAKLAGEQTRRLAAESATQTRAAESAATAVVRQSTQRLEAELGEEREARRRAAEDVASLKAQLSDKAAEAVRERRDKEEATTALASSRALLGEQTAARERAEEEAAGLRAETATERAAGAAAATAAIAEAAGLREQVARLERDKRAVSEQLEAAHATLGTMRGEIESLRTNHAATKQPPDDTAARVASAPIETSTLPATDLEAAPPPVARATTPCAQAVQGKVRLGPSGPRVWTEGSLARLCRGAETSVEPARCFDELMRGKTSWGTGSTWTTPNALILCGGTRNARQTLDCFANSIAANETWATAINTCRTVKQQ